MRVEPEFGKTIKEIIGADSYGKAALRTQTSKAYLIDIAGGKIPSVEVIERILAGYRNRIMPDTAIRLYEASGYTLPDHWKEKPSDAVSAIEHALPPVTDITEEQKTELLGMIRGYMSARHASTQHFAIEAANRVLMEEAAEEEP